MNIFLTSSSAKIPLIKHFKNVAGPRDIKILGGDSNSNAVSRYFLDGFFQLPHLADQDFNDVLLKILKENTVKVLIPTRDADVCHFVKSYTFFKNNGILPIVPSPETLKICQNKLTFNEYVSKKFNAGLKVLKKSAICNKDMPIFIRPLTGAAGIGCKKITDIEEVKYLPDENILIHPYCPDTEYSVDILMTLDREFVAAVPRTRDLVVRGESQITTTDYNPEINEKCRLLAEKLKLVGHNVIQLFYSKENGVRFIEINLRFGGASSCSLEAGLPSCSMLVSYASGDMKPILGSQDIKLMKKLRLIRFQNDRFLEID